MFCHGARPPRGRHSNFAERAVSLRSVDVSCTPICVLDVNWRIYKRKGVAKRAVEFGPDGSDLLTMVYHITLQLLHESLFPVLLLTFRLIIQTVGYLCADTNAKPHQNFPMHQKMPCAMAPRLVAYAPGAK